MFKNGTAEYLVCGEDGKRRLSFRLDSKDVAKVVLYGTDGMRQFDIQGENRSDEIASGLRLFDLDGRPRVVLGVGPAGQPFSVFAEQERLETGQRHDIADIPEQAGRE